MKSVSKKLIISFILISMIVYIFFTSTVKAEIKTTKLDTIKTLTYNNTSSAYDAIKKAIYEDNPTTTIKWSLVDIDKNNLEELIVYVGDIEADKEIYFFTYSQGKIVDLGKISGGHTTLYTMNNENYLLDVWAHMGEEIVYHINIDNNAIVQNKISERMLSDGEDYVSGDRELETYTYINEEVTTDTDKLKSTIENYISTEAKLEYGTSYGENVFYASSVHIYKLANEGTFNIAYVYVLDQVLSYDNTLKLEVGNSYPAKVTYQINGDNYTITKIEKPRDGSEYTDSLRELFPSDLITEITNTENNNDSIKTDLEKEIKEKANDYFKSQNQSPSNETQNSGNTEIKDTTTASKAIPQTGEKHPFILVSALIACCLAVTFKYILYKKFN